MAKFNRSILITDLDDTLWSWVQIWHASFYATLQELTKILSIPEEELIPKIKKIHEKAKTSEYTFLVYDLEEMITGISDVDTVRTKYQRVFDIQDHIRSSSVSPFPDVVRALEKIKSKGTKIIGYTESMAYSAMDKMKLCGLDGIIDILYSREDHEIPESLNLDKYRSRPHTSYLLEFTKHNTLPTESTKPDPITLLRIINDVGAKITDCVYVGDKLLKDVKMAQDAGVLDLYAKYGNNLGTPEYDLLKKVTNWNSEAVDNEAKTDINDIAPTVTLESNFSEIFSFIQFSKFNAEVIS